MQTYKRLLAFAWPYRGRMVVALVCTLLAAGLNLTSMLLTKPVFDKIFENPDKVEAARFLILIPAGIVISIVLKGLFAYFGDVFTNSVSNRIAADIRENLFAHLQRLPLAWHHHQRGGVLVARFTNDVNIMPSGISDVLGKVIGSTANVVLLLGGVFWLNWKLALWLLVVFPPAIGPLLYFGKKMRRHSTTGQERMADLTALLHESLAGVRVVTAFNMESWQSGRFSKAVGAHYHAIIKQLRISALSGPVMESIGGFGLALLFFLAGRLVVAGEMTTGTFVAMVALIASLYPQFKNLNGVNLSIQNALAASDRVFQILDTVPAIADAEGAKTLKPIRRALAFEDVHFQYQTGKPVLKGLTLEVKAGQMVALVGPSGAGKTTLADLVPRFMDPVQGRVAIDGHDIKGIRLHSLRAQVGVVTQETFLFNDTIAANIGFGRPGASQAEIVSAAKAANAHEFIQAQAMGYDTTIGDRGARLSGGQRQRLAIARAILKNPPILILDEATSALDTQSERAVQEALDHLMAKRTTLVIAHRLSTVQHADNIVVMDKGRIAEQGRHEALIKKKGLYAKLHKMQFRK
jgi:subfamily B ATP-binding cassette protein MsbA